MGRLPNTRYSLLARLAEPSDAAAWEEFLDSYEQVVFRYCRGRGLQESDAHDVVQEVLLAVHGAMSNWQPSGRQGSFRAWLIQTAHRVCLKTLRTQARRGRGMGGTTAHEKLHELTAKSDHDLSDEEGEWRRWAFCWAADQVRREVESTTWQAFCATAIDGEPPAEVARRLDMRVGAVYAAKCRILSRIRDRVQELSLSAR